MTQYAAVRYWTLHELQRLRAAVRVGTTSALNAAKERRALLREAVLLRVPPK